MYKRTHSFFSNSYLEKNLSTIIPEYIGNYPTEESCERIRNIAQHMRPTYLQSL